MGEGDAPVSAGASSSVIVEKGSCEHLVLAPELALEVTRDGRIVYATRAAPGLAREQMAGRALSDVLAPEVHAQARDAMERAVAAREAQTFEADGVGASGGSIRVEVRVAPLLTGDRVTSVLFVATDAARSAAHARRLESQLDALHVAIDATGMGLWVYDLAAGTFSWDARMCAMHGVEHAPRSNEELLRLVHPDDRPVVGAGFAQSLGGAADGGGMLDPIAYRVVQPSGRIVHVVGVGKVQRDAAGRVERLVGGNLDITERHTLREQLAAAQKMEALGQLAAGLAHNFNNLLSAIFPALELPLVDPLDEPAQRAGLEAATRAREVIQSLVGFARPREREDDVPVDPRGVARRAASLGHIVGSRPIDVRVEVGPALPRVRGGVILEQALLNLIINACDALGDQRDPPPCVSLRVERDTSGAVRFTVSDNGPGVSDAIVARLFQPFATTKGSRGTGLGLAVSRATLAAVGSTVRLASSSPRGATFEIVAPGLDQAEGAPDSTDEEERSAPRVLVVDDDALLREGLVRLLLREGYAASAAPNVELALERLASARFDLVLLDDAMPGLPGRKAVERMLERDPRLRIVLMSGHLPTPLPSGLAGGLQKPATRLEVVTKLRLAMLG